MKSLKNVFFRFTTLAIIVVGIVFASTIVNHPLQASAKGPVRRATTKKEYPVPAGTDPWGNAIDSKGNIWVVSPGCDLSPYCGSTFPGRFEVFNPTTSTWTAEYLLPSGYAQPLFIAFDNLGQAWFAMPMDNAIGVFNPSTNTFQKWTVPTASSGPWDVAIDHNGMLWFTEHYANKIGEFNTTTHTFIKEVATPSSTSQPYGITVDASNNVWFTENNSSVALIAEYTALGQLKEYKIRTTPNSGLTPHLIAVDTAGNVWWTEGFVGMIGKLTVSNAVAGTNKGVKEYRYAQLCKGCGEHTSGIGVASNGLVWFDDSLQSTYGSFPISGTGSFKMFATLSHSSHPHDGLVIDSLHHVWIDEEFGNKLAEAN